MNQFFKRLSGLLALLCVFNLGKTQYCTPQYGNTVTDTYISGVEFNTINNTSNASGNGYQDFTAQSTTVSPSTTHNLTVTYYAYSAAGEELWAWFDWNGNGSFADPGEAYDMGTVVGDNATQTISVSIPATASGNTRFRVIIQEDAGDPSPCPDGTYGEAEDYSLVICDGTTMTYTSSNVTQSLTNPVSRGTNNQQIIGVNVVTAGCDDPIVIKSIKFKEADSDNITTDVSFANLYYTKSSNAFNTNNIVGTPVAPSASFTINNIDGSLDHLSEGDNWFWLTYSIPAGATLDNFVDAEVESITLSVGGSTSIVTPSNANPTGKRQIVNNYCSVPHSDEYANDVIQQVSFESINKPSGRPASGYSDFTLTEVATVSSGTSQTLNIKGKVTSLNVDQPGAPYWLYAYADWNRDGDFDETNEKYFVAEIPGNTNILEDVPFDETIEVTIPGDAKSGFSRMRIRLFPAYTTLHEACAAGVARGEAEDYGLTICGGATVDNHSWFCEGDNALLSATDYGSSSVEWQSSDSATTNWVTIASADNVSTTVDSTQFFRALIQEPGCPDAYSEVISLSVPKIKDIQLDPASICSGDATTVTLTKNYNPVFTENTTVTIIPDGNAVTESPGQAIVSTIDLTTADITPSQNDYFSIDSVCLNISHSNVEDLRGYLVHQPSGKRVILFDEDDLSGADLDNTCFGPMASDFINDQTSPYAGLFLPMGNLNAFVGEENNSVWELHLQDMDGGTVGGTGTLQSWSIKMGRGTISWNPNTDIISSNADSSQIEVEPTTSTQYVASLSDAPCPIKDSVEVIVIKQENPVVRIDSALPNLSICQGDSITFFGSSDAASAASPLYSWYVNGVKAGSDSASFGVRNLVNGDTVVFETSVSSSCGDFSSSDTVYVDVVSSFTPSVILSSDATPDSLACEGEAVVFSVDTINPGSSPTISWYVNDILVSNSDTFYINSGTLSHLDVVKVEMTVSESCALVSSTTDSLIMNISPSYNPTINLSTSPVGTSFCSGQSIELTAAITEQTPNGELQWHHNNAISSETNLVWSTDTFSPGVHSIKAIYTTNSVCTPNASVEQELSFEIIDAIKPEIQITSNINDVCEGQSVRFSIDQQNGGGTTPTYEWYVNGALVPGQSTTEFISSQLNNADEVYAFMQSNATCASPTVAYSNSIVMAVNDSVEASLDISSSSDPICLGGSSTFEAVNLTHTGSSPDFKWFLNGEELPHTDPSVEIESLKAGDVVSVEVTVSGVNCLINPNASSSFTVSQHPVLDASFTSDSVDVLTHSFSNTATAAAWSWSFGDGTQSNEQNPTHKYDEPGKYEVCLTLDDANGCSYISCDSVLIKSAVSVEDVIFSNTLSIYPNPADDFINVQASREIDGIAILNIVGQGVINLENQKSHHVKVSTSALAPGIYFLKVSSQGVSKTLRFETFH